MNKTKNRTREEKENSGEMKEEKYPQIKEIFNKQIKHQFNVYGCEKGKEDYEMESYYAEIEEKIDELLKSQREELVEKIQEKWSGRLEVPIRYFTEIISIIKEDKYYD